MKQIKIWTPILLIFAMTFTGYAKTYFTVQPGGFDNPLNWIPEAPPEILPYTDTVFVLHKMEVQQDFLLSGYMQVRQGGMLHAAKIFTTVSVLTEGELDVLGGVDIDRLVIYGNLNVFKGAAINLPLGFQLMSTGKMYNMGGHIDSDFEILVEGRLQNAQHGLISGKNMTVDSDGQVVNADQCSQIAMDGTIKVNGSLNYADGPLAASMLDRIHDTHPYSNDMRCLSSASRQDVVISKGFQIGPQGEVVNLSSGAVMRSMDLIE